MPLLCIATAHQAAFASTAYGSMNNFDCVNDTGVETHGFEIELDYGRSTDITYTYDYNHYGVPTVTEDLTDPVHPKVFVRYASKRNPNGSWAAYTAVPITKIAPTMGHEFTNPSINFGGEHFGVGFMGNPSAVKYNWLIDDGTGKLVHGPAVYVATPSFTYYPPAPAAPPQVVAVIVPPPPPAPPVFQFGAANWVKEIKTTVHSAKKISLNALVGDDPRKPQPWANGEPSEVEMEWSMMQTEFAAANGGKNGALAGAPEQLPGGNEVITRRYEFYKYVGPIDAETGQAIGDAVGPDGIHGVGTASYASGFDNVLGEWIITTVDLSKVVVVGDFFGTQMAGFDVAPNLSLIDHIQDGTINMPFPGRTVVVAGGNPFLATVKYGKLPPGLSLNSTSGVLSGTPSAYGTSTFTIQATDTSGAVVSKVYTMTIPGVAPTYTIATTSLPAIGGTTTGAGLFKQGANVSLKATPANGYYFVNWAEGLTVASSNPKYSFVAAANRSLAANFSKYLSVTATALPSVGGTATGSGKFKSGANATVHAAAFSGYYFLNWTEGGVAKSNLNNYPFSVTTDHSLVANFAPYLAVTTSSSPTVGGTTKGAGNYRSGAVTKVVATPNTGYKFVNWTVGSIVAGTSATLSLTVSTNTALVANFSKK